MYGLHAYSVNQDLARCAAHVRVYSCMCNVHFDCLTPCCVFRFRPTRFVFCGGCTLGSRCLWRCPLTVSALWAHRIKSNYPFVSNASKRVYTSGTSPSMGVMNERLSLQVSRKRRLAASAPDFQGPWCVLTPVLVLTIRNKYCLLKTSRASSCLMTKRESFNRADTVDRTTKPHDRFSYLAANPTPLIFVAARHRWAYNLCAVLFPCLQQQYVLPTMKYARRKPVLVQEESTLTKHHQISATCFR